ncbi:hypothetical protein D6764_05410 [Candidatus Woesearchaeota archaeon]|nr:MAG: hypothetical protein D6764_05410 [Candidatus Woesearchaeota archaeon]
MSSKPEMRFKAGSITATIWKNEQETGEKRFSYYTVSLDRNYRDKNGSWQKTNSMRINDLPKAALVLNKAYDYLATKQEESAA